MVLVPSVCGLVLPGNMVRCQHDLWVVPGGWRTPTSGRRRRLQCAADRFLTSMSSLAEALMRSATASPSTTKARTTPPRRPGSWEDGRMGVPPESTTVEIDLLEEDGATTLRLVHHGLPPRDRGGPRAGMGVLPGCPTRHPVGRMSRWRPTAPPPTGPRSLVSAGWSCWGDRRTGRRHPHDGDGRVRRHGAPAQAGAGAVPDVAGRRPHVEHQGGSWLSSSNAASRS